MVRQRNKSHPVSFLAGAQRPSLVLHGAFSARESWPTNAASTRTSPAARCGSARRGDARSLGCQPTITTMRYFHSNGFMTHDPAVPSRRLFWFTPAAYCFRLYITHSRLRNPYSHIHPMPRVTKHFHRGFRVLSDTTNRNELGSRMDLPPSLPTKPALSGSCVLIIGPFATALMANLMPGAERPRKDDLRQQARRQTSVH